MIALEGRLVAGPPPPCLDRPYVAGGPDHSRPWSAPPPAPPPALETGGWILAGRPVYVDHGEPFPPGAMQHLFRQPGEWSLCGEMVWLQAQRAREVNELTWICAACREVAMAESAPADDDAVAADGTVVDVRARVCPTCRGPLTDPSLSPGGWRHCRACRRGWAIQVSERRARATWKDWPAPSATEPPLT